MININQKNIDNKDSQFEHDDLSLYCKRCKRFIRVSQIVRKETKNSAASMVLKGTLKGTLKISSKMGAVSDAPSGVSQYFTIFIYYCKKCDSYYFKFKTIQTVNRIDLQGLNKINNKGDK